MDELSKELKDIKKKYGEKFMHICRDNFPTLLEKEGILTQVLDQYFAPNSKSIGDDIENNNVLIDFKNFIFSKANVEKKEIQVTEGKDPYEILDEAGYKLIECKTEEEIQKFKNYYAPGELICTIYNGGRLETCLVFFAVKKDVENIKREDFINPQREDEYGTSVLGIQFNKHGICTPHIITRYNHTVRNPNATYGNNLDRLASGLTESFARLLYKRGLNLNEKNIEEFEIPGYTVASDGKYYKYNMEINGKYYCPGNIIIDWKEIIKLNPEKEVLIDYFILDKENKTLKLYDKDNLEDSFLDAFENIKKIQVEKNPDKKKQTRIITIQIEDSNFPITIEIDKNNNILGYNNQELRKVGDYFLGNNEQLQEIKLPQLTEVGDYFLGNNEQIKEINLPQLKIVGFGFLPFDKELKEISLPKLEETDDYFLFSNTQLKEISLPQLRKVGNNFLGKNTELKEISLPRLIYIGDYFIPSNEQLKEINLPQLTEAGDRFLGNNKELKEISLPRLVDVGDYFIAYNEKLSKINLPQLEKAGDNFLGSNKKLKEINLPQLKKVGNGFINSNEQLSKIDLAQLTEVGKKFLASHPKRKGTISKFLAKTKVKNGIIMDFNTKKTLLQQKEEELSSLEEEEKKISETEELIKKEIDKKDKSIGE